MIFSELHCHDRVIIAFSGGADSRYLLEKISEACDDRKLEKKNVTVAHFNHHLRGDESQRDAGFSQKISEELGFCFELGHWEKKDGEKISENSARNVRYTFLEKIREQYSAKYILTAHHKDDQAETVFLQFLRGGGVNALTGMKKISEEGSLYRPLLDISKSEILAFLSEKNISFCEDSTNAENLFTRNFVRNEVFPLIEKKFPNFSHRIAKKSEYFQDLQTQFEKDAHNFLEENTFEKGVLRKNFLELSAPVSFEVIKKSIAPHFCSQKLFSEISHFILSAQSGKKLIIKNARFELFGEKVWIIKGE